MEENKRIRIIAANITKYRTEKGITQKDLAKAIGITPSTLSDYVNLRSAPSFGVIQKLADYFGVEKSDIDTTFKEEVAKSDNTITEIYNDLNDTNKKKVINFASTLRDKQNRKPIQMTTVYITGFVSAGSGVMQDDYVDAEITIPSNEVPDGFDTVAKVIGESMAPTIKDGDLLFVKNTPQVDFNDIAVFQVNGENYVKQLKANGSPYLKSLNPDYDNVYLSEDDDIRIIGAVVGIYSEK